MIKGKYSERDWGIKRDVDGEIILFQIVSCKGEINYPEYIKEKDYKYAIRLHKGGEFGDVIFPYSYDDIKKMIKYIVHNDVIPEVAIENQAYESD